MKRLVILAFLFLLLPISARADDGWWDLLWRMDPKFQGPNGELQLCFDKSGHVKSCESYFWLRQLFGGKPRKELLPASEMKHELAVRVGSYRTHGELYPGASPDLQLKAFKFQVLYYYYPDNHIRVGLGIGAMPIWGDVPVPSRSKLILTPLTVVYSPFNKPYQLRPFFVRGEATRIVGGLVHSAAGSAPFDARPEWNVSLGIGYDFRRLDR